MTSTVHVTPLTTARPSLQLSRTRRNSAGRRCKLRFAILLRLQRRRVVSRPATPSLVLHGNDFWDASQSLVLHALHQSLGPSFWDGS